MDYVAEAWGSSTLAHDGPFSATCVSPCRSWERPPRRHRTPWRRSVPWRRCARCGARCGGRLERALQAADEAPRRRLAPGEGAAEALALDELTGAEVPVQGGGVARPLRRPCACAFGLAAQRQPQYSRRPLYFSIFGMLHHHVRTRKYRHQDCLMPSSTSTSALSNYPVVIITCVHYLGPPGPFYFPDSRDLLEVLGGLPWQRERGGGP